MDICSYVQPGHSGTTVLIAYTLKYRMVNSGCLEPLGLFHDPATIRFSSVESLSRVWLFATPCTAARQASLFLTNSRSLLKLMSIETGMPLNYLILCHPLLLLPSIFSSIRVFSNESVLCIRWPKYWSFSFNISPSSEYSELTSSRIDWFDLLAVQGTLKSLLQHHSSKASILRCSAFFMVQFSWSNSHIHTWLLEKPQLWLYRPLLAKQCLCFLICCLGLS